MNVRLIALFTTLLALAGIAQAVPADARGRDGGETKIFADVYVPPGETIDGDVNVVFGDATIAGVVTGDCNAVFGQCTLRDGGVVRGQINGVTNDGVRAFVPWAVHPDRGFGAFADQDHRLFGKLLGSGIVILIFLLFPLRMRVALDRVEKHPALSAAAGAVAAVAIIPIGLLLLVSVIGIPLIPLEIAAIIAGVWIGTGAIALLVGRRLCELVMPSSTPSPLMALVVGLVVVSAAEIVPFVGWAVSALVWLIGLGAALLSFIRSTQLDGTIRRTPVGGSSAWR
ncbi:MAG: hypothetical protein JWM87_330 [Candidatus Eremiobacteraeota bacterium]|nr:hypothetical protein [Candidatus Eremiobacteraeota bacterium]